jgi:hypothetical protein
MMRLKYYVFIGVLLVLILGRLIVFNKTNDSKIDEQASKENVFESSSSQEVRNTSAEEEINSDEPVYDPKIYSWSTMKEGPYRDKISFATSSDLLNWKDSGRILAEHASVPDVVYKDGVLYVYFVDVTTEGYAERLGLITSSDNGKTWSEKQFVQIKGIGQKAAVDPAPILLDNGKIRLFYFDIAEARRPENKGRLIRNKIYSAISDDGLNFVEEDGIRFEYEGVYDPSVIKVSDNLWRMFVGNQDGQKVFSAVSDDGMKFNYEGVAYTGGAIPNVIFDDGSYYLFTGGVDISTSKDGITFKSTGKRFDSGKLTADPGVVKIGEKNYFMIYKTKDPPLKR